MAAAEHWNSLIERRIPAVQTTQHKIGRRLTHDAGCSRERRCADRKPKTQAAGEHCSTHALQRSK